MSEGTSCVNCVRWYLNIVGSGSTRFLPGIRPLLRSHVQTGKPATPWLFSDTDSAHLVASLINDGSVQLEVAEGIAITEVLVCVATPLMIQMMKEYNW